jgi:histidinol-phosphate aminotransferase
MKGGPEAWVREEILALKAYAVAPAEGMIKLDAMENPYRLPGPLRQAVGELIADAAINRYPDPAAPALKARLRQTMGIPETAGLVIGNGSDELITLAAQALARPGAVMLAPEPTFAMYRMNAVLSRMRFVGVSLRSDFTIDPDAVLAAIETHQPALVFVAYPNNPTGNLFPEDAVERIVAATPGLAVVDEAYQPFAQRSFMPRLDDFPNLVVMRTVSKLGLAGVRLGYAAGRPEWIAELDKVRPPYNVSVLTQVVAERVLAHADVLEAQARAIREERGRLHQALARLPGVTVFPSAANFLLVRVPDAPGAFAGLRSRRVLVRSFHGSHPLLEHCLRVTVGTPEENQTLLAALRASIT